MSRLRIAVVAVAALLGACVAGFPAERIWEGARIGAVTPLDFSAFASAGATVAILGAPPGGASEEAVVEALRLPSRFRQAPLQAIDPFSETPPRLRLVFAFGIAGGADGNPLCAGTLPAPAPQHAAQGLEVLGALCDGARADTMARLSHPAPLGPDDPAFAVAMTRLIDTLAPRDRQRRDRSERCFFLPC